MNPKMMNKMRSILKKAQALRKRQNVIERQLVDVKANLADAEVEYADLQKEISDDLFGQSEDPSVDMPKRRSSKKKTTRRKLKKKTTGKVKGTRAQIRASAKARDDKLIKVLRKAKNPMNIEELHKIIKSGSRVQVRTSIKRMRKQLKTVGYARNTRYALKRK